MICWSFQSNVIVFLPKYYSREEETEYVTTCKVRMGAHHLICWKRAVRTPYLKDFQWWMVLDLETIYLKSEQVYNQIYFYRKIHIHDILVNVTVWRLSALHINISQQRDHIKSKCKLSIWPIFHEITPTIENVLIKLEFSDIKVLAKISLFILMY